MDFLRRRMEDERKDFSRSKEMYGIVGGERYVLAY